MKIFVGVILVVFFYVSTSAQVAYKLDESNSKMVVSGTSSIHEWEMGVNSYSCKVELTGQGQPDLTVDKLEFTCLVESITSGNGIMDSKTFKALNGEKFPHITFTSDKTITNVLADENQTTTGNLNIAGNANQVAISNLTSVDVSDGFITKGEYSLLMSDYGIKPPKAMMGALKTGDEVKITFEFKFLEVK